MGYTAVFGKTVKYMLSKSKLELSFLY